MYIKRLHISSFGTLIGRDVELSRGMNVLSGPNESGKTSVAMFIKFLFYGMPAVRNGVGERERYVNWKTGEASGYAEIECDDGREYRIERVLADTSRGNGKAQYRESVRVVDLVSGTPMNCPQSVGEYFLGVPEQVFVNTAFVRQLTGVRPESEPLSRSVENIVCAADEGVNVKKALDAIDRARVALLHKNRTGGRIVELEAERERLRAVMEKDRENSGDTIKTEAALDELRRKLSNTERQAGEFDALFETLDLISKKRKLDAADTAKEELARVTEDLEHEKKGGAVEKYEGVVAMCERNFEAVRRASETLDSLPEPDDDDDDDEYDDSPYEDIAKAERIRSRGRALIAAGIVFTVLFALGAAGAAFMYFYLMRTDWFFVAAGATILLLVGVIFFALGGKKRSDLSAIVEGWGAENMEGLADAIKDATERKERAAELRRQREKAFSELETAESASSDSRERLLEAARDLAVPFSKEMDDGELLDRVRSTLNEKKERISALESSRAELNGRLTALNEQTAELDRGEIAARSDAVLGTEIGKQAAEMTQEQIREAARKRDFCHGSTIEMKKLEAELERTLAGLKAVAKSPAGTAERIDKIDHAIDELKRRHDAYVLAYDALSRAGDNMRSGILPKVRESASGMMREISGGKYDGLSITPGFDLFFTHGDSAALEADYLSSGTGDAAYLSLRLALIKALFSGDGAGYPPVVLDESFARLDADRLDAAARLLTSDSFGLQSLLCTCREEEADAALKHGGHAIRL